MQKINSKFVTGIIFPLVAAFIWGSAFVAQSVSAELVGPFTFTSIRSFIAFFVLLIVSKFLDMSPKARNFIESGATEKGTKKDLYIGGICCGVMLSIAANLQQSGLAETSAGKAGFITALYIVFVPIIGLLLKKKVPVIFFVSVFIAAVGLYLLCVTGNFTISGSDLLVLFCAIAFAVHIMFIDHFTQRVDGVKLSCVQFLVVGIVSLVLAMRFETVNVQDTLKCTWPILYAGVFSSGIAYTLQIISQKGNNPTVVSLLFSLESVFAALTGALILHNTFSARELFGSILIFVAVILAQIPKRK